MKKQNNLEYVPPKCKEVSFSSKHRILAGSGDMYGVGSSNGDAEDFSMESGF